MELHPEDAKQFVDEMKNGESEMEVEMGYESAHGEYHPEEEMEGAPMES